MQGPGHKVKRLIPDNRRGDDERNRSISNNKGSPAFIETSVSGPASALALSLPPRSRVCALIHSRYVLAVTGGLISPDEDGLPSEALTGAQTRRGRVLSAVWRAGPGAQCGSLDSVTQCLCPALHSHITDLCSSADKDGLRSRPGFCVPPSVSPFPRASDPALRPRHADLSLCPPHSSAPVATVKL
ncbi:hypothetical protein AAFF_G00106910 [Aldrovandia affinis]|uniref:Uncharacterized protein n=1 Tax=Aldrovandia affinis TaxID=143900 RepID=A0AAD7T2A7_9TELE|nr:hypothetical protein AAFF_G00106910 [Aldrovandia affinis]